MTQLKALNKGIAVVIGINKYTNNIPKLKSAVNDGVKVAEVLQKKYGYEVLLLLDEEATLGKINQLLASLKQGKISLKNQTLDLAENDRCFFYFAGHGIALDALDSADGPQGFLVPQDANLKEEQKEKSLLAMTDLHDALIALPCRHLLVTLDCCFGGSFRWAGLNRDLVPSQKLYRERYQRFTNSKAQQVITSAAYDEKALDSIYRLGQREEIGNHSPFAEALLKGLAGEADFSQDGAITATELYVYLQSQLSRQKIQQTPGTFQLKQHEKGEYLFPIGNFNPNNLETAPPLDEATNPYRGLASFDEKDRDLFFGRKQAIEDFYRGFKSHQKSGLTAVLGASGTGKSSLVKAGLLPRLREDGWYVVPPFRPGKLPFSALAAAILLTQTKEQTSDAIESLENELKQSSQKLTDLAADKLLLVIDQFEELVTDCPEAEKENFLTWLEEILIDNSGKVRVIITLRSDFKGQFSSKLFAEKLMEFTVPMMTQDEFREIIERPAAERVLYFEPPGLVDGLINEVVQMPGGLPLLSFTLSQLYFQCCDRWLRGDKNRALTLEDYNKLGGVMGVLKKTATDVFEKLIERKKATEQTIRHVMLRMVAVGGDGLARRRVPLWELEYPEPKNGEVKEILKAFIDANLLVTGTSADGEAYIEPAHDALVNGWDKILTWKNEQQEDLLLQRRLTPAAVEWQQKQQGRFLWNADPYLDLLRKALKSDDNWFNEVEEEFVRRSIQQKGRNVRWRWGIATAVIVGLSGLTIFAELQRRNAVRQSEIALARQLATESRVTLNAGLYQRGTLLAVESLKKLDNQNERSLAADEALRVGLSLLPDFVSEIKYDAEINAIAFSPDGKYVATASSDTARVWDAATGKEVAKLNHDDRVSAIAFSPDSKYLATASDDKTARVWDAATGKELVKVNHDDRVSAVAFSPDGKYLATANSDTARVWEAATGLEVAKVNHDASVNDVTFSPDGKYLATASDDKSARVWFATTGKEVVKVYHNNDRVSAVVFSPDSKYLATAGLDKTARVWLATTRKELTKVYHDGGVNDVTFSPDGKYLATASDDKTARVWEAATGKEVAKVNQDDRVWAVAFSPDGKYLTTASSDTARVWDATKGKEVIKINHDGWVNAVAFSPDGKYLATANSDTARVWEAATGKEVVKVKHDGWVNDVAFSPDGKYIATASWDNTARVWEAATGKEVVKVNHDDWVNDVAFSPDGKYLATASNDKTARVWDATTWKEVAKVNHDDRVSAVTFSPDGKYLATASNDKTARVWDATTWKEVIKINHDDRVWAVAFSPNGKYLATASNDKTARVWEAATGKEVAKVNHDNSVGDVAFSPDGKYLATASEDKTARVWDATTWREVAKVNHDDSVRDVAFSPDGKYLATASFDNTVRVHFVKPQDLIDEACQRLSRNFTVEEWEKYMNLELKEYQKTCDNLPVHPSLSN